MAIMPCPKQGAGPRVPFFDLLGVDLNPGVSLLGESTTPGFKSALG